jgi:hypothetical protein
MSKVLAACPYCRGANAVEKSASGVDVYGCQKIQCAHCSKSWSENLSAGGSLAKSASALSCRQGNWPSCASGPRPVG